MKESNLNNLTLNDGSKIAVIGGGPAGSFFTYFALDFAQLFGTDISVDIYEAKNFKILIGNVEKDSPIWIPFFIEIRQY